MATDRRHHFRSAPDGARSALVGAGHIVGKHAHVHERTLTGYACVHIVAGGGTFRSPGHGEQAVVAGDLLLLFPGVAHSYASARPGDWTEWWLMFSGPVFSALVDDGVLTPDRPLRRPGVHPELVAEFDALVEARRAAGIQREAELVARTHLLLTRLHLADPDDRGADPDLIARACAELERDLHRPLDLQRLADDLGYSYERFRKLFTAATGTPPARWRQERRIDRAKALLADDRLGMAAVAERLGYCDVYFFSRQFRLITGKPPGRYRREDLGVSPR